MWNNNVTRRRALIGLGGTALGLLGSCFFRDEAAEGQEREKYPSTGEEALQRLQAGNQRFVSGKALHPHTDPGRRAQLQTEQHPFATILGCSDSRVPPELLFDQGFGDLFVIRVAGNVIAPTVLGSLQYALVHLHTPLLMVMGHEGCGAVTAALEALTGKSREPARIGALLKLIEPGLKDLASSLKGADRVKAAVEANVRWSMKQLAELPEGKEALAERRFKMVGAVYELDSGKLRLLPG